MRYKPKNELFVDAMDQFGKLAEISLKALRPYKNHAGPCATSCPSCELKLACAKVEAIVTEIPRP